MNIQGLLKLIILIIALSANNTFGFDVITADISNGRVNLRIELEESSYTYWYIQTKVGLPTTINLENMHNVDKYFIDWPWPKVKAESSTLVPYYEKNIVIPIYIKPLDPNLYSEFSIIVNYISCSDFGCMPKKQEIFARLDDFAQIPEVEDDLVYSVTQEEHTKNLIFKTKGHNDQIFIIANNTLHLPFHKTSGPDFTEYKFEDLKYHTSKVKIFSEGHRGVQSLDLTKIYNKTNYLLIFIYLFLGFVGGATLNLMPCVLPVLALKLYGFTHSKDNSSARIDSLVSILTIIFYFSFIAFLTIVAKSFGQYFIPGFSLQKPVVIISCIVIITIFVSVIRGKLRLEENFIFLLNYKTQVHYIKVVLSTLVSTLLATPCTAPFLATSVTFALGQSYTMILLIYLSAAIGFALPYFVIIFYPKLINFIPKPGKWQNLLRVIFYTLLMGTLLWLFWILYFQIGIYSTAIILFLALMSLIMIESNISHKLIIFCICVFSMFNVGFITDNLSIASRLKQNQWESFSQQKLNDYIKRNDLVFVYVTAEWCATCQVNKIGVLNSSKTIKLFKDKGLRLLEADLTKPNPEANYYLYHNSSPGIPFGKIYGPANPDGIGLPVIFSLRDLEDVIDKVSNHKNKK
ncbi:MAG: protein-disulfide reductase DsbD family protein [Rickettsiaceae bacterium]|nr:protein-disulfide reductase DsbD family protein [Rickettsiaceae bacterium]